MTESPKAPDKPDPEVARPPPLRDIIARHGLASRRTLGQHFLLDYNLTRRIARSAGSLAGVNAIEVGPGPGGLTRALLESDAAHVFAIERDHRCIAPLLELGLEFPDRLTVVEDDALKVDLARLCPGPRKIVANLPYNISTKLLTNWLTTPGLFAGMILMFQKEVAMRLAARPGGKEYGRLSVLTQWLCETETLFDVSPRAFTPPPNVASTVVALTPRPQPAFEARQAVLERLTAAAFGQRRKMLRSSLKQIITDPSALLARAGIEPTARAENLSVEDFCTLARIMDGR